MIASRVGCKRLTCQAARLVLVACILLTISVAAHAQHRVRSSGAAVRLGDQTLFYLYGSVGSFDVKERARLVTERLQAIANDPSISVDEIQTREVGGASEIHVGETVLVAIVKADTDALGLPPATVAERYVQQIRHTVADYRAARSIPALVRGALYSLVSTLFLLALLRLYGHGYRRLASYLEGMSRTQIWTFRVRQAELIGPEQMQTALLSLLNTARLAVIGVSVYLYLAIVFSSFPWTQGYAATLLRYVVERVQAAGAAFVSKVPDLLTLVLIGVFSSFVIRAIRHVFRGLEDGTFALAGFEREWAVPTFKLVRVLILAAAAVAMFPYIPGSDSPAFRGISVFLGVVVSLGSTGAISNMVAGVILIYMHPFRVGDRVRIADTTGDVIEKSILVTRIRTIKNIEVTIPNALVLAAHIHNFSANARDGGIVLHTTVTIGYDVPWRRVHALLLEAARRTPGILKRPAPYVLQTALQDNYVAYELNAYSDQPNRMATTYSMLHQSIQDTFGEAGVEILSPQYRAIRDGNPLTVPGGSSPDQNEADTGWQARQLESEGDV